VTRFELNEDITDHAFHFTIQGKYEVGGAEEPATLLQIFNKIKAQKGTGSSTTSQLSGNTCWTGWNDN
jgi:hypothetical protein